MTKRFIYCLVLFLLFWSHGSAHVPVESSDSVTIFLIGDSTMADKNTSGDRQERGWGQLLPRHLKSYIRVKNHAVNGRSSKSFLDEGRWERVMNQLKPGDYVIIQFGHNDEKKDKALHTVPGGTFDRNLTRYVRDARKRGAQRKSCICRHDNHVK